MSAARSATATSTELGNSEAGAGSTLASTTRTPRTDFTLGGDMDGLLVLLVSVYREFIGYGNTGVCIATFKV